MAEPTGEFHLAIISGLPFQAFPLKNTVVVGRSQEADIRIDHPQVSRQHCRLEWTEEGYQVADLGSRSGTVIGGVPITGPHRLTPGEHLDLGPVTVQFDAGPPPHIAPKSATTRVIRIGGKETSFVPLRDGLVFGRYEEADVVLNDPAVSRRHLQLKRSPTGWKVEDLKSTTGALVNGQRFDEHELVIGDRVQVGPYQFEFDGKVLVRTEGTRAESLAAQAITYRTGDTRVLHGISFSVPPSAFAGIIGPSGAGKSSLLHILSGLRRASAGEVLIGGHPVKPGDPQPFIGFVPQADIVHEELTVAEALRFAAELRLPADTPSLEIQKLVLQTMRRLNLIERAGTRISALSGGQRKRVSVGAELMSRPSILFLDEPTSGLDPSTEFKLMELLRDLADSGCTIVATTHVMENIYLVDQLLVVHRGNLLFSGTPQDAREHFGVAKFSSLYDRLPEQPEPQTAPPVAPPEPSSEAPKHRGKPVSPMRTFGILLRREWTILKSDRRNFGMLLGQPLLVGGLLSWATNDASLILFFAYLATLWFGCSNGAQEIVSELPIYRRERVIGVGRHPYLWSKLALLGGATFVQAMILFLAIQVGEWGVAGSVVWQFCGLTAIALVAAAIGCAISALSRTVMQAVLAVPFLLIPFILFSGHPVPVHEMRPAVFALSRLTPTFSAQRLMDVSFLWNQQIARDTLSDHWTSFRNLNRDGVLKTGQVYHETGAPVTALLMLALWFAAAYGVAVSALRAKERS